MTFYARNCAELAISRADQIADVRDNVRQNGSNCASKWAVTSRVRGFGRLCKSWPRPLAQEPVSRGVRRFCQGTSFAFETALSALESVVFGGPLPSTFEHLFSCGFRCSFACFGVADFRSQIADSSAVRHAPCPVDFALKNRSAPQGPICFWRCSKRL